MKIIILVLSFLCFVGLINAFAKEHYGSPKDSIKKFKLRCQIDNPQREIAYVIKINRRGKIRFTTAFYGGERKSVKKVKLDKRTFIKFKAELVNKIKIYSIPDSLPNPNCNDGGYERFTITSSLGKKNFYGHCSDIEDHYHEFESLLFDLVGSYIAEPDELINGR